VGTEDSRQAKKESSGNDGAVESLEIQRQDFHPFQRSLEISQRRRDSHISTAPAVSPWTGQNVGKGKKRGLWKSGNPKSGFPLSHSPGSSLRRKVEDHLKQTSMRAERIGSAMPARSFHAHPALETNLRFMLILRLENAASRCKFFGVPWF